MFRYVHTNLVAKDAQGLIQFYKQVMHCKSIGATRNLKGKWLDRMTNLEGAHIVGEHLALPGYEEGLPTIEIFSYDEKEEKGVPLTNRTGFGHLAFEVEDVEKTLQDVLAAGGGQVGEVVRADYPGGITATFVYATDPEGNILELQSWSK